MSTDHCNCLNGCPGGAAAQYSVAVTGITNGSCTSCASINGTYILSPSTPCVYNYSTSSGACNFTGIGLNFTASGTGVVTASVSFTIQGMQVMYQATNVANCMATLTLTRQTSSAVCTFPSTITLTPIGGALADLPSAGHCMPTAALGHAPGTNLSCAQAPFVGTNSGSAPTCGANLCGGGGDPFALPPNEMTLCDRPGGALPDWPTPANKNPTCCACNGCCGGDCGCGCGGRSGSSCNTTGGCASSESSGTGGNSGGCGCGCGAGDAFTQLIHRLSHVGPGQVNLSNGNLLLRLELPTGGVFSPAAHVYYNSLIPNGNPNIFGIHWTNLFQQSLSLTPTGNVTVMTGSGSVLMYTQKDNNGRFAPPRGVQNSLVQNADGTYTETQVDGLALHYASSGAPIALRYIKNRAGAIWTLTNDGQGRLSSILDPVLARTTFAYSGSYVRSITDTAGRVTSFTNVGGLLTKRTQPDGTFDQFLYNAGNFLRTYIDPDGARWSYTYDGNNFIRTATSPRGFCTTYTWIDWNHSTVTDPGGGVSTITYNPGRNIVQVTDAQGNYTTVDWFAFGPLMSVGAAAGPTTAFGWRLATNRTWQLDTIEIPPIGTFSLIYDSSDRVKATVDYNGHRTSLTWNSLNQRTAVKDAVGDVCSLGYTSLGPVKTVKNPLGNVVSHVFNLTTGQRTCVVDPTGARTSFGFSSASKVVRVTNPLGQITTALRDVMNRVRTWIDALGHRVTNTFEADGHLRTTTTALGFTTTQLYDPDGNVRVVIDAKGGRVSMGYDSRGNRITVQNQMGQTTTTVFNRADWPKAVVNPLGDRWTTYYDGSYRVRGSQNPLGFIWTTVYDLAGRVVQTSDPLNEVTSYVLDAMGNQRAVINPLGNATSTLWDAVNRPRVTINPVGSRTSFGYDAAGDRITVQNPLGFVTSTVFDARSLVRVTINALAARTTIGRDAAARQTSVLDALGGRATTVYLANGLVRATVDQLGNRYTNTWDADQRLIARQNPLGRIWTSILDQLGNVRAAVDPLVHRVSTAFDAVSRPIAVTNGLGFITSTVRDADGRAKAVINPLGFRYSTVFDATSQPIATIDPLGRRNSTVFDPVGRVKATIDGLGFRSSLGYDAASQNTKIIDSLGRRNTIAFDVAGRVHIVTDALGFKVTNSWDAASQLVAVTNPVGAIVTTVFDPLGRTHATVDGLGFRTTIGWDVLDRMVTVKNPLGNVSSSIYLPTSWLRATVDPLLHRTTNSFDGAGERVSVRDANNNLVTTVFDPTGRPVASISALGFRVTSLFDAANRRTAIVDARGFRYSFGYSKADEQVTTTDPLGRVQSLVFDGASQPVVRIDGRGFRVSQVFDNAGQLTGNRYPDGSRVSQIFDAVGNRRVLADSTGRYTTTFDALNRGHVVVNPALKTITVTWDGAGRRRTMTNPDGGITTYQWSKRDQCTSLVNADSDRTSWSFDPAGRQTLQLLANGVRVSLAYDVADRLVRLSNLSSTGTTISSFRDTWDATSNRLNRIEADGTLVSWSYDKSYQLVRERRSGTTYGYDTTYAYDPGGNRTLKIDSGARTTTTLDAANQLVKSVASAGTTTFAFDANGNQRLSIAPAGGGTTTNTWDFENRLTKVQLPSGIVNTFTFNADNQRVEVQDSTGTAKQIYDGEKVALETDQTNSTQVVFTSSPGLYGGTVSQKRLLVPHYHVFDPLGSTDRLTSSAQAATDTYIYKAFGEILLAGTTINAFRFVGGLGYRFDSDLSTYWVRQRNFGALIGRWFSVDAVFLLSPDGRAYAYARNAPLVLVDPSGMQEMVDVCRIPDRFPGDERARRHGPPGPEIDCETTSCDPNCCKAYLVASPVLNTGFDHLCIQVCACSTGTGGPDECVPWAIELLNKDRKDYKGHQFGSGYAVGLGSLSGSSESSLGWGIYVTPYRKCLSVSDGRATSWSPIWPSSGTGRTMCQLANCLVNMGKRLGRQAGTNKVNYRPLFRNSNSFAMEVVRACLGAFFADSIDANRTKASNYNFTTGERIDTVDLTSLPGQPGVGPPARPRASGPPVSVPTPPATRWREVPASPPATRWRQSNR
jgi:RHS repeat-associated protein